MKYRETVSNVVNPAVGAVANPLAGAASLGWRAALAVALLVALCFGTTVAWADDAAVAAADGESAQELSVVAAQSDQQLSAAPAPAPAAVPVPTYTIVYKLKGGKQAAGQVLSIAKGSSISVAQLKKPTRTGYTFKGWYTDKKLTKKAKRVYGQAKAGKRTLYAKWKRSSYKIVYKLNGGTLPSNYTKRIKVNKSLKTSKLAVPTRTGYKFKGWYSNKKLTKSAKKIKGSSAASKRRVYAKWAARSYSIAYVLNGGKFTTSYTKKYKMPSGLSSLPVPYKKGYAFQGWFADSGLTQLVTSIPKYSSGKKTLYAKWRKRVIVAHRGYHVVAPENTIAAMQAAKAKGFDYVEIGVRFTKDNVPLLIHNASAVYSYQLEIEDPEPEPDPDGGGMPGSGSDGGGAGADGSGSGSDEGDESDSGAGNGDGSGSGAEEPVVWVPTTHRESFTDTITVASKTYDELVEYYDNLEKLGVRLTRLDRFDDFISVCAKTGIEPYIEIKRASNVTADRLRELVDTVDSYGMGDKVFWISFSSDYLKQINAWKPHASMTFIVDDGTAAEVKIAKSLAASGADVSLDLNKKSISMTVMKRCRNAQVPLEIWTLTNETKISSYDKYDRYISGYSVNALSASKVPSKI